MSNREYNITLCALWETKNGNSLSMRFDERSLRSMREAFDRIENDYKAAKEGTYADEKVLGGKFIVKRLSDEARGKFKDPERAPQYFLEYITRDSAIKFENEKQAEKSRSGGL